MLSGVGLGERLSNPQDLHRRYEPDLKRRLVSDEVVPLHPGQSKLFSLTPIVSILTAGTFLSLESLLRQYLLKSDTCISPFPDLF